MHLDFLMSHMTTHVDCLMSHDYWSGLLNATRLCIWTSQCHMTTHPDCLMLHDYPSGLRSVTWLPIWTSVACDVVPIQSDAVWDVVPIQSYAVSGVDVFQHARFWCSDCNLHHLCHVICASQFCSLSGLWESHQSQTFTGSEWFEQSHLLAGQLYLGSGE